MRRDWRSYRAGLPASLLLMFASPLSGLQQSPCSDEGAVRALVRAYVLSSVFFESKHFPPSEPIQQYVMRENRFFVPNGPGIICARTLALRLLGAAINIYDPHAYERAMEAGPSEFASDVARSTNTASGVLLEMAFDLQWLSDVLPDLAQGDATLYNTTGTSMRAQAKSVLPLWEALVELPENAYLIPYMQSQLSGIEILAERNVLATVALLQ